MGDDFELLVEIAAHLKMIRDGLITPEQGRREAAALIDKIAAELSSRQNGL